MASAAPPASLDADVLGLPTLPEDLQHRILLQIDGVGLSSASCSCVLWRALAQSAAQEQMVPLLPAFARGGITPAPWIRALAASERLCVLLGPADRSWRAEWKPLRMAQAALLAEQRGRGAEHSVQMAMEGMDQLLLEAFDDEGGHLAVAREAQHHVASIEHLVVQGLERERATACALLLSLGSAALARALRDGEALYASALAPRRELFAASVHHVAASLRWLALSTPPAPPTYANLYGDCAPLRPCPPLASS